MLKVFSRVLINHSYEISKRGSWEISGFFRQDLSIQRAVDMKRVRIEQESSEIFPVVCSKVSSRMP